MKAMIRQKIIKLIQKATNAPSEEIRVEHPEREGFGDYATNIALQLKKPAAEIAKKLLAYRQTGKSDLFEKIEAKEPGFINFFLSKEYLQGQVSEILKQKEKFGQLEMGRGQKVNVESISANPTGSLHIGNGRNAFSGDVLANVLEKAGYKVTREYFINDAKVNTQIRTLGKTALGKSEVYLTEDLKLKIRKLHPELEKIKDEGEAGYLLAQEVQKDNKDFIEKKLKIRFDNWISEEDFYKKDKLKKVFDWLKNKDLVYEKDKAWWVKTSQFGAERDWVVIREMGEPTYLLSDIAYHKDKFDRGFSKIINIWGADHQAHVSKMKAAFKMLCCKGDFAKQNLGSPRGGKTASEASVRNQRCPCPPEPSAQADGRRVKEGGRGEPCDRDLDILILQLITLRGKEKISKRKGKIITLEDLVDEIGLDVARFLYLQKSLDTHIEIDLALAKEQSEKNPVYYVQYASARMHGILAKLKIKNEKLKITTKNLKLLEHPSELSLIKQLIKFPEIIEDIARDYQVQRLPQYAMDLATVFHQFYRDCRVIPASPARLAEAPAKRAGGSEDKNLTKARLSLVLAVKTVLRNTLSLMGISAPEKM